MRLNVHTTKEIILILREEEVMWLKGYIQNGMPGESEIDRKMRKVLWDTLSIEEGEENDKKKRDTVF